MDVFHVLMSNLGASSSNSTPPIQKLWDEERCLYKRELIMLKYNHPVKLGCSAWCK